MAINEIKLLKLLIPIVFISLAIISITSIVTVRISTTNKELSQQNRTFLTNFSDFMACLVVPDEQVLKDIGKAAYFNQCNEILFRNTGLVPHPVVSPTTSTTR